MTRLVFIGMIETPYERIEDCPRNIASAGPLCRLPIESIDGARVSVRGLDCVSGTPLLDI